MSDMCVYTALHQGAIEFMRDHWSKTEPVWFSSKLKWATASDGLFEHKSLPLLIRIIEDEKRPFACTYLADLIDMHFKEDLGGDKARRKWMLAHREMQRQLYSSRGEMAQFEPWEIDKFFNYKTHFAICNLRCIKRLPLPSLVKWLDGTPLSGDYRYGYSLCSYPKGKVKVIER